MENSSRDGNTRLANLRNLYADQEQQLEMDMEQQTGPKLGMEYVNGVYCHSAYLSFIQSTS